MPIEVTVDVHVVQVVERAPKADIMNRKLRWGSKPIALLAPFGQGSEHRVGDQSHRPNEVPLV